MEYLEAHARLEQKKKAVLRRQQRELQKKKREAEVREKELQKLAVRCREMEEEERISIAMEAWYRDEEERKRMEIQRLEELKLYKIISETRKKTMALGLSASTPGVSGLQRLRLLEARIVEKEVALKKSNEAKIRLDALPMKRNKLTQLMHSCFSSSIRKKVENAVYHQYWDHLVPLFDPATTSSADLLNHESENGSTPVLVTIFKGKLRVLRHLLKLGASPNTETRAGMTPLLAAVMTGNVVALSILMEFKVDLSHETKNHVNAVLLAADKGREEILKILLEYGANVDGVSTAGRSTLIQAAISGNADLFRILLAYGASKEHRDHEGKAAVDWAIQLHNTTMVSMLNSSLSSANLLAQLKAEEEDEDEEVLSPLSTNRVVRQKRMAEMDKAMRKADLVRIRELLSSEGFQHSPNYEDAMGNSPLLVVCNTGTYADIVFCLKNHCIPTHQNREGINALMIVCKRGDIAMILLLLKCGCNLLTRDFSGRDAFHYLNTYDHPDLAIEFTNKYHKQHRESNSGLLLGSIVSSMSFVKSEYTISTAEADISLDLENGSTMDETESIEPVYEEENGEEELRNDPVIRKWSMQQETFKRDRQRRQRFNKEREHILAARTRGRRNGLIAPLPSTPAGRLKFPTCNNCQQSRARKRCPSCDQVLCDKCHARLHELAYRRHHQYEELEPELYVGHERGRVAQTNQENSLQHAVLKSVNCVADMHTLLLGDVYIPLVTVSPHSIDPEVENYHRKKQIAKEKAISQLQINVPVVAAKHAAQAGEENIFSQPAELELATLYTTQKKYEKARELLQQVEKLVTDSLGILHSSMLKVAIGKARISQETSQFEQCVGMMQDALSLFEGVLPLDHKDILIASSMLLQSLDVLGRYHDAVKVCRHVYSIRLRALPPSHKSLKEIQEQMDEFISKRETVEMSKEDLITLEKIEQERKRMEQLANESEKHLANFRNLLMEDSEGLATFLIFARQEFAEDLVTFWISIEEFKEDGIDSKTLRSRAVNIYLTYINSRRIKVITAAQRKKIKKAITTPGKKLSRTIYDDVQAQIFELVYKVHKFPAQANDMPTSWTTSPQRYTSRHPSAEIRDYYSSPSSSDDNYRCRGLEQSFSRKIDRSRSPMLVPTHRDKMGSRYNSTARLSSFERYPKGVSERVSLSQSEDSSEVYVTTMDEDDQQMFIALFYWRRKVLKAHFSAWKWVAYTLRRSAKQIHRHGMNTRPRKSISTGYDSIGFRPTRRNLILKRYTGLSSAEESERDNSGVEFEKPVATKPNLNTAGSKPIKENNSLLAKDATNDLNVTEKRRQFRTDLRLVFSCFSQWKLNANTSRKRRVQQLVQATNFHHTQQLKTALQAWKYGSKILKAKRKRLEDADQFHWSRTKRDVFREWKRYCRVKREIARRQTVHATQQKGFVFQHWYQCILQTRRCRNSADKRCHNHLRLVFRCFREGLHQAALEHVKYEVATSHYQKKLQVSMLHTWRAAIFEDPSYLLSIDCGMRICLSSGVRKWRRFMTERQTRAHNLLIADFFRYRTSLWRAVRGWRRFLKWKRERKQLNDDVQGHYERNLKTCVIRKLRVAAGINRSRRRQVRMATRWHQRRLAIRSFKLWVISARKSARFNIFCRAVHTKTMNNAFSPWRRLVTTRKNLKSRQFIVSERWNGLIMKKCMARWLRTLHVHSFIASLELKRRNMNTVILFRTWQSRSKEKISRRNIVAQQRLRNEETLLQRVMSQWFDVTLRKRCLKRLVKLFRKKQTRQRIKSIFRLWRVHVNVCIATRKRDLDRARLSLVEWRLICRECKEKRMIMEVATQYYCERRYAIAINLWSSFAARSSRFRRAERKALSHYFGQILVKSLQHWYVAARGLRRQEEFLAYRQQKRDIKAVTRCLHAWLTLVRRRIQYRTQEWAALQFRMESLQRRFFYAWVQCIEARRVSIDKLCCAIATYESCLQTKVLRAWHLSTTRSIHLKRNCILMQQTVKQRRLQSCVTQWSEFCFERRRRRKQVAMADKFYHEFLLCLAMCHWQENWSQTLMLRHKEMMAARQINTRRLATAVSHWYENYQHSLRARAQKTKARRFYTKKMLVKHFGQWKRHQEAVRHKVSKRRFVTRLRYQKLLARMFRRWRHFSETSALERVHSEKATQHRALFVLHHVFQGWKMYRSKQTLYVIAYTYRRRLLFQKAWIMWQLHREHVAQVRQNVLVTNQLIRNNLFRATFVRWKAYASHHRQCQSQLDQADEHYIQMLCKRAVVCLRKQVKFHQAVVKAATFGRINGVKFLWKRWRYFVTIKRNKRSRRMLVEQTYRQNRKKRHFCTWKMLAKRCMQGRRDKSDALYRVSCLRMVWARWNRTVSWRKCIVAMEHQRLEYLKATILRRWRAHVHSRIERRAKTTKAVAFQKAKLRSKTWKSWLRYITYCHDKQKQLVWVLSYYSVDVLLRRSFASWKELMEAKQVQREHNELAASFNTHRLVREGYHKWIEYVERRKMRLERVDALLHQAEIIALSRSVRKWRNHATVLHQHHQNETSATQFYNKRRLTAGLSKLLRWRKSQKNSRTLLNQAKRFRDNKAVTRAFRCWQRYHQWRVKYTHLTQVFKRNQKGDVFTRWKTFWRKRQSVNEKRLQARIYHCVRVEQSALTAWRRFVHVRKQKRVAATFNKAKVLRSTFAFWKRRVHVLRQMRKMFLYQESFRAQTHFDAWKRFVVARKQMNERLRRAMKFKDDLRKQDVWQKWSAWVSVQRQERATIELAVGFRERFFMRKIFAVWKGRTANWKRQRILADQAQLHFKDSLLRRGFRLLVDWRQSQLRLIHLQRELSTQLVERRKRRVIANLRALCAESDRKRGLIKRSCHHWQLCHQQKYWGRIMQWFDIAKFRKHQRIQADAFARKHLLRRPIVALRSHIIRIKQLKAKVDAFRRRYFRSVADDCFYLWRSFITFKLKLHALRRKTRQSQRRQRLQLWHHIAVEEVRRRAGIQQIAVKRRHRELVACFNHWESVITDLWIEKEIVAHHQRHAQRQRRLRCAVNALKSQLPARHERQKCKTFFLQHRKTFLIQVLQHWRQITVDQQDHFNM